ncbi:phosphoribosylaminoimidazolecarboxamide formyltransferase [Treponema sp. Marseille-Q4132]|uniref:phosphoribosylaminoimidazolecarboxamide formyltransferase n=1 Tax=Treponema sp. Marseille-Q4132 TaxID=2766701 RepID=UPI001652FC96|nr:phosphoribosylaminoimidazolecarboxamide formyltransferase [Treponema sp. Marseille-Q4132]QNL96330.1 phosphoribosylaminoimidazolecarboxamide formyltransferase [Treponema sp. Marseille-Q4132]
MTELLLKYGCNPNQKPSRVFMEKGKLPFAVLNGMPGYINLLDALNGWQLVKELRTVSGISAAASFKHVSPAGAAVGLPLSDTLKRIYFTGDVELSPLASAYARARGADRMSSFGDFIALSDPCDEATARLIAKEVSDGVIAPGYDGTALDILKSKKKGAYVVLQIDGSYVPEEIERKQVFGITFEQGRNNAVIDSSCLKNIVTKNKTLSDTDRLNLLISLIVLKYTQSNSVAFVKDGQAIGVGAGQQSRVHCTRLAAGKADTWWLRRSPQALALEFRDDIKRAERDNAIDVYVGSESCDILADGVWQKVFKTKPPVFTEEEKRTWISKNTGVAVGSDAFFPFGDNIERAHKSGASVVAEPGGSIRDDDVIRTCDAYGMVMAFTGMRLFHH